MPYKIKKAIPQYSLVDIFEILLNKNHPEYNDVLKEFDKRTPSEKEIEIAKKGLKIRLSTRSKPLSFVDKIYCFLVPLFYSSDRSHSNAEDAFHEHLAEFEMYGETRRVNELLKWQRYSKIFYIILFTSILISWLIFRLL